MEARPEAAMVPAAPPPEGRRTLRFEDVSEVMDELEQENDQLREEVERLMSSQERWPSQGSRRPSSDYLEDGPRQRWSRAVSAVSRRNSVASVARSAVPRRSVSRASLELDGQLDAALVENHELSDRLRNLERERQLDAEAQASHEAAVAELTARVRQLERENLELEARNEELAARAASSDSRGGADEGSDGGTPSRRSTQRSTYRGSCAAGSPSRRSTQRSTCRSSAAAGRSETELRPSLLRAQAQIAELEAELAAARLDHQQLLGRTQRLEAESEELGLLLEQQRKATDHSRREAETLQAELRQSAGGGAEPRQGWSLLRQLMHAAGPGADGQDGGPCAECPGADGQPGRREECGDHPRGSTGSTGSSGCEAGGQAELLSLRQECQRLWEEGSEARADARRVPELLSDIIGLQDELAAAQATIRELEAQSRPDLFTRWFDSIACAGARPSPGSATMPSPRAPSS